MQSLKHGGGLTLSFSVAPVQVKELTFSCGIAAHDLTTKLKQVESWLEKKHHIRITLRAGRGQPGVNLVRKSSHNFFFFFFFQPVLDRESRERTGNV